MFLIDVPVRLGVYVKCVNIYNIHICAYEIRLIQKWYMIYKFDFKWIFDRLGHEKRWINF